MSSKQWGDLVEHVTASLIYSGLAGWLLWRALSRASGGLTLTKKLVMTTLSIVLFGAAAANLFFFISDSMENSKKSAVAPPPVLKPAEWRRYEFKEAAFSALFPAPPEFQTDKPDEETAQEDSLEPLKYRMHLTFGDSDYRVVATVVPEGVHIDLEEMQRQASASRNMEMVDRKSFAIGDSKGYELLFKAKDGIFLRMKVFVLGEKYFQVIASVPQSRVNAKETDDFLGSVQPL